MLNTSSLLGPRMGRVRPPYTCRIASKVTTSSLADFTFDDRSIINAHSRFAHCGARILLGKSPRPPQLGSFEPCVIHRSCLVGDNFGDNFLGLPGTDGFQCAGLNPQVCNILWTYGVTGAAR